MEACNSYITEISSPLFFSLIKVQYKLQVSLKIGREEERRKKKKKEKDPSRFPINSMRIIRAYKTAYDLSAISPASSCRAKIKVKAREQHL